VFAIEKCLLSEKQELAKERDESRGKITNTNIKKLSKNSFLKIFFKF